MSMALVVTRGLGNSTLTGTSVKVATKGLTAKRPGAKVMTVPTKNTTMVIK